MTTTPSLTPPRTPVRPGLPNVPAASADEPPTTDSPGPADSGRAPAARPVPAVPVSLDDDTPTAAEPPTPGEPAKIQGSPSLRFLVIECPKCSFELKLLEGQVEQMLGRKARCPKCQVKFYLPSEV